MATLEKIRKRGPIVALIIGLALIAFILGDVFRSGDSLFSRNQFQIAEVGGESIQYQDFESKVEEVVNIYKLQTGQTAVDEAQMERFRQNVWDQLIRESLLRKVYNKLGIGVSNEELFDMVQGKNVDPMIYQSFANPETGQFDPASVINFLKSMDQDPTGNSKTLWLYIENELAQNRVYGKYINMVSKGLYVTKAQVNQEFVERNYLVDFKYVAQKYSSISDSTIKVTEEELKKYYEEHKNEYKQEESRSIEYITFDVVPSNDDRLAANEWINKIKSEFQSTSDVKQLVNRESDVPMNEKHYKKGEFPNAIIDSLMFAGQPGFVYGPYEEDNTLKLARLVEFREMSDSVLVRHILIQPDGKLIVDAKRAKVIADSLLKVIKEKKGDFKKLVELYSADKNTIPKGGELPRFVEDGQMAKEFRDGCFKGKKGDIFVAETQFGAHVIEILDADKANKKIQIAILQRKVEPSTRTYQSIYTEASKFSGENNTRDKFEKSIKDRKFTKKVAPNLVSSEKVIAGLENPREMVRWAYKSEKDAVSTVFEFGNRYVIAVLTEIREKGLASFDQVKPQIEFLVKQDKKGDALVNSMKAYTSEASIEAIAEKLKTTVDEAKTISFSSFQLPNAGVELELIASSVLQPKDKISAPIKGKNGVYIFVVTSITPAQDTKTLNLTADKVRLFKGLQSRANYQAFEALKEIANVVDQRAKFY